MKKFTVTDLKKIWQPKNDSNGEDNGQVTIIGGSKLFHGAPILAMKAASRTTDMVFFTSPEASLEETTTQIKAQLNSFIWVPWAEADEYIKKSEAVLIGPGLMRFHSEKVEAEKRYMECDEVCQETTKITRGVLYKFPEKKWVIDGGSLQVMEADWIPRRAIVTPNIHEFRMLFGVDIDTEITPELVEEKAKKYACVVVYKGPVSYVSNGETTYEVEGGNAGLTKGGTGDTLAGLTVGLLAKNEPLLAAAAASLVIKKTAEYLYEKVGYNFNADDVSENCFEVMRRLLD